MNQLKHHQKPKDSTPLASLNRLFKEYVPNGPELTQYNCVFEMREIESDEINSLIIRHTENQPRNTSLPIIIMKYSGKYFVIDGNNRVNFWKTSNSLDVLSAIEISIK